MLIHWVAKTTSEIKKQNEYDSWTIITEIVKKSIHFVLISPIIKGKSLDTVFCWIEKDQIYSAIDNMGSKS